MKFFLSVLIALFFLSAALGKAASNNDDSANPTKEPKLYCIGGLCPTGLDCNAKLGVCLAAKNTTKVVKLD
ncbi:hypothetical protein L596_029951 [Steinernema carpocapsae]|uniref:Uncharacterized protein n=1 Tax=Steinernema carpocapsae TaxID=34508 RepID=A0A4U5LRB0_STECR|nr:hypothetical protein L596_029951 [Steinernema carpocapsae]